jgi:hypothetical protein
VVVLDRGHLLRPLYGVAAPSVAPQLTSENPLHAKLAELLFHALLG